METNPQIVRSQPSLKTKTPANIFPSGFESPRRPCTASPLRPCESAPRPLLVADCSRCRGVAVVRRSAASVDRALELGPVIGAPLAQGFTRRVFCDAAQSWRPWWGKEAVRISEGSIRFHIDLCCSEGERFCGGRWVAIDVVVRVEGWGIVKVKTWRTKRGL